MEKHFFDKVCSKVQYEVWYYGTGESVGGNTCTFLWVLVSNPSHFTTHHMRTSLNDVGGVLLPTLFGDRVREMSMHPNSLKNLEMSNGFKDNATEKQRKIASMGGKAKGKAYAERAKAQEIVNAILASPVIDDEAKANLEKLGLPKTMFWKMLLGAIQNSELKPDMLRIILELTGDMTKDKSNVTVNAVPIIFGGENELK